VLAVGSGNCDAVEATVLTVLAHVLTLYGTAAIWWVARAGGPRNDLDVEAERDKTTA
jgi:hypothetical protein